ncbi:MAG: DnaJ domain-containing protein, partial [Bdellovibrionales bacterium]|nr:DnaJ domain-containing protein [Bdellovibrionales bacterium]
MISEPKSSGLIGDIRPAHLFLWIVRQKYSGTLALVKDPKKKTFVFEEGKLVATRSNLPDETLLHMLIESKQVEIDHLKQLMPTLEGKESYHQGEELMKQGIIDAAALYSVFKDQMELRISEAFGWTDGKYMLIPQVPEGTVKMPSEKTMADLIYHALKKNFSLLAKDDSIDPQSVLQVESAEPPFDDLKWLGKDSFLYRLIDGRKTLSDLCKTAKVPETVGIQTLWALNALGIISVKSSQGQSQNQNKFVSKVELLKEVAQRIKESKGKNYFELLGVDRSSSETQIKQAYFELAKKYHPDRVITADFALKEKKAVEDYFSIISMAHGTLSNSDQRKEYIAMLETDESGLKIEDAERILNSEVSFQKALVFLKKGIFLEAKQHLMEAIKLYDEEPEYHMILGWCIFKLSKERSSDIRQAKELIQKSLEKNEKLIQGY